MARGKSINLFLMDGDAKRYDQMYAGKLDRHCL